jgi:hypothetical protein
VDAVYKLIFYRRRQIGTDTESGIHEGILGGSDSISFVGWTDGITGCKAAGDFKEGVE